MVMVIFCWLRKSIALIKENSFTLKKRAETITDADYADDLALLADIPAQAESLAAGDSVFHVNANKTEYIYFEWDGAISILNGWALKLFDKFIYPRTISHRLKRMLIYA